MLIAPLSIPNSSRRRIFSGWFGNGTGRQGRGCAYRAWHEARQTVPAPTKLDRKWHSNRTMTEILRDFCSWGHDDSHAHRPLVAACPAALAPQPPENQASLAIMEEEQRHYLEHCRGHSYKGNSTFPWPVLRRSRKCDCCDRMNFSDGRRLAALLATRVIPDVPIVVKELSCDSSEDRRF
jgi:hypothetical protein